jgi:RNA recognition motif-containing protein
VSFSLASSTVKAVAMSGEAMLKGRRIKIDYARENKKGRGTSRDPKESKPPGCTTVWVGNLARGMTSEMLAHEFRVCGPVKEAKLVYDKRTGEFRGHAYVSFQDNLASEATDKAVNMSGTVLDGKPVIVQYSAQEWVKPRSAKNASSGLTVSVSPLPRNITLQDLRDYFAPCGEVESVHWSRKKHNPIPPRLKNSTKSGMIPPPGFKGRAYVQFVYLDGSRAALAMSQSSSKHGSVPPWGGDPLTIAPAADAER